MKVCFPVKSNEGVKSTPYNHFGSAPQFIIVDSEDNSVSSINNGDLGHEHGKCQPIKALNGVDVDAVVVAGIGQGAIIKLNSMGIKVYEASKGSVEDNLTLLNNGGLKEFNKNHTCDHHDCGHHGRAH